MPTTQESESLSVALFTSENVQRLSCAELRVFLDARLGAKTRLQIHKNEVRVTELSCYSFTPEGKIAFSTPRKFVSIGPDYFEALANVLNQILAAK